MKNIHFGVYRLIEHHFYALFLVLAICLYTACQNDPPPREAATSTTTSTPPSPAAPVEVPEPPFVKEGVLEFRDPESSGTLLRVDIEIAHQEHERNQGLMWRKSMEENQAMLFVFDHPKPQSFWMRNTYISLDIIYVSERFEVVSVLKNVPVLNDTPRPSGKPAQYAIEVNAGVAEKYKIVPGTLVAWSDYMYNKAEGPFRLDGFN